ncbi:MULTISPECIES: hypothetical protein [Actinosynnema]|uniref:hypothetical protein n=1 Tax=Actinosynnema TaxID=40566 RepID=UPI0020A535F5|nr:hypothetical protein [Actinosynnema pretiosum]MCP2094575.1 hypothetical protein [Actinosynnema pretiosum]
MSAPTAPATRVVLADGFAEALVTAAPEPLPVPGRAVVLNLAPTPALLGGDPPRPLPPLSSTTLVDGVVERAGLVAVLRVADDVTGLTGAPGWRHFADLLPAHPREVALHRGPRTRVGRVELDAGELLGQERPDGLGAFDVWLNLWFAPAGTDCGLHDRHDFIEVHTQLHGLGRMQKFHADDRASLHEEQLMAPGHTPPVPFCRTRSDGGFHYPWHQYRADTDCAWLAVEYHRTGGRG